MKQLRNALNKILNVLAGGSFLAMAALTCWQVFTRYVLKNPSSWSEELVSYLFAWMALFGASLITGERGHMNIPIVTERMGKKARMFFAVFAEVIACLFAAVILVYGGVQITNLTMGQMTSSLGVPVGVFYLILPFSGAVNILYTILNVLDIFKAAQEADEGV
ncbi:MAG: TRAP transporter small permease [Lachnospiraceae bacterium]